MAKNMDFYVVNLQHWSVFLHIKLLGKISSVSPVGSAILGRRIGDEVTVSTPGGEQIYTIDSIN